MYETLLRSRPVPPAGWYYKYLHGEYIPAVEGQHPEKPCPAPCATLSS